MQRIHADAGPFDFDGRFYKLKNVSGRPAPVQRPRPVTLNAAFSPPGRDFAARAADYLFTTFTDIDKGRAQIDDMRARAAATGRDVGVYTTCHVVCRPSADEAEAYYEHYAVAEQDAASVDKYMKAKQTFSGSHEADAYRLHRKRFAAGAGTYPLVGTPAHIAGEMVRMAEAGFAGTTVSFVNFRDELPYFIEMVLPLLRDAGLRD
jgi:FMNH2-dependent dimethyl sulfone monooxygenase